MIALLGSLALFILFEGLSHGITVYEWGHVASVVTTGFGEGGKPLNETVMTPTLWIENIQARLDQMASFAMAGVALSIFDRVAAWRLSLAWALDYKNDSPANLKAAMVFGWCILASTFVYVFAG